MGKITRYVSLMGFVVLACSPDGGPQQPGVELFGPGRVSSELPEFATTFSPGGDTVLFNRTPPDRSRIDLFISVRTDDAWSAGEPFGPLGGSRVIDPFLTPDGTRLYFSSDLPREGATAGTFNLWFLERAPSGWGDPIPLPEPINSDSSDVFNSVAGDGTMVFSSRRDGVRRVYETRATGEATAEAWSDPVLVRMGDVDTGSNPAISPDGDLMVVSLPTPEGPPDLFVSCRLPSGWGEPQRLPEPVNSRYTEFAPGFGPAHLYFTSERPGVMDAVPDSVRPPGDIYRTPRRWIEAMCAETPGGP